MTRKVPTLHRIDDLSREALRALKGLFSEPQTFLGLTVRAKRLEPRPDGNGEVNMQIWTTIISVRADMTGAPHRWFVLAHPGAETRNPFVEDFSTISTEWTIVEIELPDLTEHVLNSRKLD